MYSSIKRYLNAFSVSGREYKLAEMIQNDMAPYCDESHIDAMGNLICFRKGRDQSKKLMIASHMDEIGFVVTYIEESGLIRVAKVGGINAVASSYQHVKFENGTIGIVAFEDGVKDDFDVKKMVVDIGAKTRAEAQRKVVVGDVCAVAPSLQKLMGSRITAKAFDDRICCAVNFEAAARASTPAYDTYYVFTVQEEVGCRGSRAAACSVLPDIAIALDITPTFDLPGSQNLPVKLGGGAAIKVKDASVICSDKLNERLRQLADTNKIKWQHEILVAGGTDTSSMQTAGAGSMASCISVPTRYTHTPVEMIDLKDFDACTELLVKFIEEGM